MTIVGSGKLSDLRPVKRSYLTGLDARGEYSPSVYTLVRRSSFVAQSVVLMRIDKSFELRTNLIVEDGFL